MLGCLVSNNSENIWKAAVVAYFKLLSQHSSEEMRKITSNLNQVSRYSEMVENIKNISFGKYIYYIFAQIYVLVKREVTPRFYPLCESH
jgi:hypothetical protein